MSAWWRKRGNGSRFFIVIAGALLALNIASSVAGSILGGNPGGPSSSSYATAPDGLSAWATVLREDGVAVSRVRETLDAASLDPSGTLVVADPSSLEPAEIESVTAFVHAGGRLVVGGFGGAPLAEALIDGLFWSPSGPTAAVALTESSDIGAAREIVTSGAGRWSTFGDATPLFGDGVEAVLVAADVGEGRVLALADTATLSNDLLARADDAALAIALAGEGRAVQFAEAGHGYADTGGVDLPKGWGGGLIGLSVAALVWMWSRGRRLGPPIEEEEVPPPPRRAYVDALAATIARAGAPAEAAAPLQARARANLARRAGVDDAVADDELRRAALRAGVSPDIVEWVLAVPAGVGSLVDLGHAAARLEVDA